MAVNTTIQSSKILVVDDEQAVRKTLSLALGRLGYEVAEADGFDAVRRILGERSFDLITCDIQMPGTDGIGVLKWLREHHPDTGVVMATGIDNLEVVIEAMRLGAYGYILKPFNLDLVGEQVARALERQRLVAENKTYQQQLEQLVAERTEQLEKADALLRQVVELQGRDRLRQLQMSPPAELAQAYREILEVVAEVVGAERVALYRPAVVGSRLEVAATKGPEAVAIAAGDEGSMVGILASGQPWEGTAGEVGVPVAYNDEVLGSLLVAGIGAEYGRADALNALWRLAREVALVLRMMQMAEDLERGELELDALLQMEA